MKGHPLIWTEAEKKIILENYKILQKKELVVKLREELGVERTVTNIKCFYNQNHLNSGMTGYFRPGDTPYNKGRKMPPEVYEKCKATMFKKGQRPHNTHPVGTEVYQKRDGKLERYYWYVKIAEPDVWRPKHHLIWEQANGPIPVGCNVMFIDGNSHNCSLENLRLITKADMAVLNHKYKEYNSPEEREVLIDIVQIENKAKQRGKKNEMC